MAKKITTAYVVFSILAFLALSLWTTYRYVTIRTDNVLAGTQRFEALKDAVAASYQPGAGFAAPGFRSFVRSLFLQDPALQVLLIASRADGVHYLFARHGWYVQNGGSVDSSWKGSVVYNGAFDHMFTSDLELAGRERMTMSALFTVLDQRAIFPLLRQDFIAVVVFLFITGIMLIVAPLLRSDERTARRAAPLHRAAHADAGPLPGAGYAGAGPLPGAAHSGAGPLPDAAHAGAGPTAPGSAGREPATGAAAAAPEQSGAGAGRTDAGPAPVPPPGAATLASTPERPAQRAREEPIPEHAERESAPTSSYVELSSSEEPLEATRSAPASPPPRWEEQSLTVEEVPLEGTDAAPRTVERERPRDARREPPPVRPHFVDRSHLEIDEELPPGLVLPSLEELAGEPSTPSPAEEIDLVEELDLPVAAPQRPAAPSTGGEPSATGAAAPKAVVGAAAPRAATGAAAPRAATAAAAPPPITPVIDVTELEPAAGAENPASANDELADIEDFEDLEQLDGMPDVDITETPIVRPKAPVKPPVDEPAELEELTPLSVPEAPSEPPKESGGLLKRIMERGEATGSAGSGERPSGARGQAPGSRAAGAVRRTAERSGVPAAGERTTETSGRDAPRATGAAPHGADSVPPSGSPYGLFSPETGLGWAEYLEKRLSFEIDRAASFDQDLSIALVECPEAESAPVRAAIAKQILINFVFQDLCFEAGAHRFAIILPNHDVDQALRKVDGFRARVAEEESSAPQLFVGLAARNGRLLSGAKLKEEAAKALEHALGRPEEPVFALRVDPGAYRAALRQARE